jgi:transposase
LPRGQRDGDRSVYRVNPQWEGQAKHSTKAFEAMALLLLPQIPVAAMARHVSEAYKRVWRMLHAHVAMAWNKVDSSEVWCFGYDELSARKGQRYVSVFCDLIGK